ncbi:MAG TPA: hypothetical protein VME23_03225 [Terracidiphilus sp.]|nr:hypothetical protein [Terracidiphilus sp.]
MPKTAQNDRMSTKNGGMTENVQSAIKAELNSMLEAPIFAQSGRCKRFISHVVNQTLQGRADALKERSIGVDAFGRPSDYDTAEDPIVRVTANEVRKRIGQFYQDSPIPHAVQIELPKGAYVPEFRIHPVKRAGASGMVSAAGSSQLDTPTNGSRATGDLHQHSRNQVSLTDSLPLRSELREPKNLARRKLWIRIALLVILISAGVSVASVWIAKTERSYPRIWYSFQHAKVPVLVCLGAHDIPVSSERTSPGVGSFLELVMRKQTIPVDDVTVITEMASQMGKQGIPFRVASADQTSLTDLRRQPVILIGAVDNIWTQRVTQDLRYRLMVIPAVTSEGPPVASIVDSKDSSSHPWTIDFSVPVSEWKSDYGIVARMDDPITGVPVIIDAGLGNDGSLAASEFITSGASQSRLANDPLCRKKSNFEAVVETNIIGMRPGPPHVLRLECW